MTMTRVGPTVAELMSIEPVVVQADASAEAAERLMSERGLTGLPVVDALGRLQGVLSQTDLVRAHAAGQALDWPGLAVRHLMTSPAITIRMDEPLLAAARRMEHNHVHRLVVVAPDGQHPVGVLSTIDLVGALADLLEQTDGR